SSIATVRWSVVSGRGTVDAVTGVYTAPNDVPSQETVVIRATADADPNSTADISLTLSPVSLSVAPKVIPRALNESVTFTATLGGTTNTGLNWSLSPNLGMLTSATTTGPTNTYTAPPVVNSTQTVTLTVTSAADPAKSDSATITLTPVTVSVSPAAVALRPGQSQQFTPTVTGPTNTAVTWSPSEAGANLTSSGLYTAPAVIPAQRTLTITATSAADPTKSSSAVVTLLAPPTADAISPTNSAVAVETFWLSASDPDGFANISTVSVLVNDTPTTAAGTGCYVKYNRSANQLFLVGDTGNAERVSTARRTST
ncbi:MAG: hypothetical protein HYZ57_15120, partial [Acidobacteria bacterium]|nr:hypothetical protein [Acidobacteriota bacterium]